MRGSHRAGRRGVECGQSQRNDIAAHVTQAPIEGVSFAHTFNQADAPTQHQPGTTRCSVTGPSATTDGARFVPGLVPASPRRRRRDATTEARSTPRCSPTSKPTTGSSVQRSPSRETASSTTPGGHRCRSPRRPRSTTGPSASPRTCRSPKPAPKASWSPMVVRWAATPSSRTCGCTSSTTSSDATSSPSPLAQR
jgi:hypothetical protein